VGFLLGNSHANESARDCADARADRGAPECRRKRARGDERPDAGYGKRANPNEPSAQTAEDPAGHRAGGSTSAGMRAGLFGHAFCLPLGRRKDTDAIRVEAVVLECIDSVTRVVALMENAHHGRSFGCTSHTSSPPKSDPG